MANTSIDALAYEQYERIKPVDEKIQRISKEVEGMVDNIVNQVCSELDNYLKMIDDRLIEADTIPISDQELDMFTLNIPSILYMVSAQQENLGIKEDVSRSVRNEVYNCVREKAQGTVSDKDTAAELSSQAESVVNIVYARAYRKVKLRVESAWEMLNSVKKVMSRRIAEYELSYQSKDKDSGSVRDD